MKQEVAVQRSERHGDTYFEDGTACVCGWGSNISNSNDRVAFNESMAQLGVEAPGPVTKTTRTTTSAPKIHKPQSRKLLKPKIPTP